MMPMLPDDVKAAILAVVEDWRKCWSEGEREASADYASELLAIMNPFIHRGEITSVAAWSVVMAASDDITGKSSGKAFQALDAL
jgi:hypothetical protein